MGSIPAPGTCLLRTACCVSCATIGAANCTWRNGLERTYAVRSTQSTRNSPFIGVPIRVTIQLARVTLREIHLRLHEPFRSSAGEVSERRILLLELTDADGTTTWSECVAQALPTYSPDTVDTCWLALSEWLVPRALGVPLRGSESADALLAREIRGHRMARAAIEMGVWALAATKESISLATLLARSTSGPGQHATEPRKFVETGIVLGLQRNPEALVEQAQAAHAVGYRRIKVKIEPERDVAYLSAVRSALGRDVNLAVDANGSYSLHDPAHVRALEALDALGLTMIEQPLAHDDLVKHAILQQRLITPICLDESITSAAAASDMLALGSGRMVNIKPGRVGGLSQALRIHDACSGAGIPVWCGGMHECGIGRAYNVALASLPGFTEPGDLSPGARYWARDVVSPEWTMDDEGRVRVPLDRPGLGIDVDTGMIDDLTVRSATFAAA